MRNEPLFNTFHQFIVDVFTYRFYIVIAYPVNLCNIAVTDKFPVFVVMSGRKRHYFFRQPHKVLGLTGKDYYALIIISVIQRTNTDGIPCRNIFPAFSVINYTRKFRIKHTEHIHTVLLIQGQKYFAVGIAVKSIFSRKLFFQFFVTVYFSVTYNITPVKFKGLHSGRCKSHNCKSVKSQKTFTRINNATVIGAARNSL